MLNFLNLLGACSCLGLSKAFHSDFEGYATEIGGYFITNFFSKIKLSGKQPTPGSPAMFIKAFDGGFLKLFAQWENNPRYYECDIQAYGNFKDAIINSVKTFKESPVNNDWDLFLSEETMEGFKNNLFSGQPQIGQLVNSYYKDELEDVGEVFSDFLAQNLAAYYAQSLETFMLADDSARNWLHARFMETVNSKLDTLIKKVDKLTPNLNHEVKKGFLSDFMPVDEKTIVGRQTELQKIHQYLNEGRGLLLLNGMGGIGKTTLATLYTQKHKADFNHIVWINAAQGIYEGFVSDTTLATRLGLTAKLQEIQTNNPANFAQAGFELLVNALTQLDNGLLVVDNEQNEQAIMDEIRRKLLGNGQWKLLVTAREEIIGIIPYKIDELNKDEARQLFYQYFNREQNDALVYDINELLMRHTLMVELIAKNANDRNGYTLAQLKNDLQSGQTAFMQHYQVSSDYWATGKNKNEYIYTVLKNAFTIAEFAPLETDDEPTHTQKQITRQLLTYWCLMPERQLVPFDTFCQLCQLEEDKPRAENILNKLSRLGWLEHNTTDGNYLMHPLLQQALRWQLQPQPKDVEGLVNGLNAEMDYHFDVKHTYIGARWLQAYIEGVAGYFLNHELFKEDSYDLGWQPLSIMLNHFSLYFWAMGDYTKALFYGLYTIAIKEKILGTKETELTTSYSNIALIYQDKGELDKALIFALKGLTIDEEVFDPKDPSLATSYSNIAIIYRKKAELDKALEFALKALEIREEVLEAKHPDLATSYNNIALIYQNKGDLDNALEFSLKALEIREEVLDAKHPDLASSYNNIAVIYSNKGDSVKALEFALKVIKIWEEVLETNHPRLATSYSNIALIYQDKGELVKALEFAFKAKEIREEVLDAKHPSLAISYSNIAAIYFDQQDYINAKKYIDKAIEIYEYNFPDGHPYLDTAKGWLAKINEKLGG